MLSSPLEAVSLGRWAHLDTHATATKGGLFVFLGTIVQYTLTSGSLRVHNNVLLCTYALENFFNNGVFPPLGPSQLGEEILLSPRHGGRFALKKAPTVRPPPPSMWCAREETCDGKTT